MKNLVNYLFFGSVAAFVAFVFLAILTGLLGVSLPFDENTIDNSSS